MMMNKQILPPQCAMFNIELRYRNNAVLQIEFLVWKKLNLNFSKIIKLKYFRKKIKFLSILKENISPLEDWKCEFLSDQTLQLV